MSVQTQIAEYLASLAEPSRADLKDLHRRILGLAPACRLWFLDGKDANGKVVSNPSIGYGLQSIKYADGRMREFYRVGISANALAILALTPNAPARPLNTPNWIIFLREIFFMVIIRPLFML